MWVPLHRIVGVATVLAMVGGACACGGSSTPGVPTAPGTTPVIVSLTLTTQGPILVGETSALIANLIWSDGHSQVVSADQTTSWKSSNPAVATISTDGFVTGITPGNTLITVGYGIRQTTGAITVAAGGAITSCGQFTGNGPFTVGSNIQGMGDNCVSFTNGVGVQLDCQGHDIVSLQVSGGHNFAVKNCLMHSGGGTALSIQSGSQVTVDSVDVAGRVQIQNCQGCSVTNSSFHFPSNSCVTSTGSLSGPEVSVSGGQNNTVDHDTIDGGWPAGAPTSDTRGCGTGVTIANESSLRVTNNTIRNVSDSGIDGIGATVLSATVQGNTITHSGVAGITSLTAAGWQNSTFGANTVSDSPALFKFLNLLNSGGSATFVGNQFVNNTFAGSATSSGQPLQPTTIDFVTGGGAFTASGNLLQGNNFGPSAPAPVLNPASAFTDGGGNVCAGSTVIACMGGGQR